MKTISINLKRFDKSIPLPVFKTKGAVAADMYSRLDVDIAPNEIAYIPLNVAIEIPPGYCILQFARSSTHKLGLKPVNGVGVYDRDYCGDGDEYHFIAQNFTDHPVHIEKATRICQIMLIKTDNFIIKELDSFKHHPTRGGMGSTGVK
jgi:dUTP pyrophosphatase